MGQYYIAVILAERGLTNGEFIRAFLILPYGQLKLMEHSYLNNPSVATLEKLISRDGMFYKSRVVWAGDYADKEPDSGLTLHLMADDNSKLIEPTTAETACYRYIVNHTKKQYVDKEHEFDESKNIHPLPLLTAEGNGRGNGDYKGSCQELVGTWARDVISVERLVPEGYAELVCEFSEF